MSGDSFERGGRPRSVPDPHGKAYDAMIRQHRALTAQKEAANLHPRVEGPSSVVRAAVRRPHSPADVVMADVVRVLNGPRVARHEIEQGHIVRGIIDGATAAADLEFGRSVVSGVLHGHFKLGGSHSWKQTRKWLGEKGLAEKNQHVHHALIPNNGWGKSVPDAIKNQPWNVKATESPLHHIRIHSASRTKGLPRFSPVERYWHGTPSWWKAANGTVLGHVAQAIGDHLPGHAPAGPAPHPQRKR